MSLIYQTVGWAALFPLLRERRSAEYLGRVINQANVASLYFFKIDFHNFNTFARYISTFSYIDVL